MSNILLLGGGLQSLSMARGLKECGHRVINFAKPEDVGRYSNFIDEFIGRPFESLGVAKISRLVDRYGINLIIPMEDEYAEWLSEKKRDIEALGNVKCAVEDYATFSRVLNKASLLGFCKENGVPHPSTASIDPANPAAASATVPMPALIKPDVSNGSRGICRVSSVEELCLKAPQVIKAYGECSLQELIEQDHYYNVMLYRYADGTYGPSTVTCIKRFYPVKGGSSSYCTTISNPEIEAPCRRLLELLDWKGFADFDVLEKGVGDFRIIEINPRVPASVHAALVSGVNYGDVICRDLLDGKKTESGYHPGESLRCLGLDIAWFAASPERFSRFAEWMRFFGKHLHYQEGGWKDRRAMAYSIWCGIKKQMSPSFRKAKGGMN